MSIEKYLESIKIPEKHPGPFAVRLKYQLQKEFFESRRRSYFFPAFATTAAMLFLLLASMFIIKPELAENVHYAIWKDQDQKLENILFVDEGEFIGQKSKTGTVPNTFDGEFYQVSDLSKLDKNKSYIIKKVQAKKQDNVFYVSEIKGNNKPKVIY